MSVSPRPSNQIDTSRHLHEKYDPCVGHGIGQARIPLPMMALLRLNEDIPKEVVPGCLKKTGCMISKHLPKDEPFLDYSYPISSFLEETTTKN